MNKDDVKYFADLARIEISEGELEKMATDIGSILNYIDQIKDAPVDASESRIENSAVRNVMRPDENSHKKGRDTDALIKEAPDTEGNLIKTKKIL